MSTKKTTTAHKAKAAKKPVSKKTAKPAAAKDNKTTALIAMLTKGATAEHMAKTLGWLPHTLRGALSRLKTKEGLKIERERVDGTTSYRIA
jgi:predicted ArsR family transcriptional regulator